MPILVKHPAYSSSGSRTTGGSSTTVLLFVVFLFVLVLFVFIRIPGRHRVAHDHERTPVDQPSGKVLGDVLGHVAAPRMCPLEDFTRGSPTGRICGRSVA